MKNSEIYNMAMCCVIDDRRLDAGTKLEIVEKLINDRSIAEYSERKAEEKDNVQ